ncbi:Membrane-bound lytic murein transglycosylase D [Olavius algarvensis Delta 1 endosymbiont]|nr:Membrane-bound lytic murein transglycosylase D [Olavius algarvensis Delta 1 endosymbiont]
MNQRHFVLSIVLIFILSACAHLTAGPDKSPMSEDASALAGGTPQVPDLSEASLDSTDAANGVNKNDNEPAAETIAIQKVQNDLDEALELCKLSQESWQQGELENAVEALDRAYALILSVDTSNHPKHIQQKEDLRFMISKRILEIYASRNIVVNGNHNAIPVVVNRHVQAELKLFTKGGERRFFIESLIRSGRYRDRIVSALKDAGLPEELSWLPLIESGFKTHALSNARALGLWQFIPSTGYKFGLNRNKFIDERMDPAKATRAAIDYLKELHSIFGDWSTVLAAYNCGEGRVLRVIRSQNINYLDNFWDLYERLPRETARYVPRFLATLHVLNNLEKYGMDQVIVDQPLEFETVTVDKQVSLANVARTIGVNQKALKELNPELRYKITPGDSYNLRVPPGHGELLLAQIDRIPVSHPPQRAYVYHRVRPGESLSVIARKYRTSVGRIMRANNMRRSNYIVAGKRLKIPQRGYRKKTVKVAAKPRNGQAVNHVVRKGDSLYIIAKHYGTTTKKIQELNRLKSTTLHIGQVLKIYSGKPAPPPSVDGLATYEVKSGDSPFLIAKRHKMPLDRLLYLNQLYPGTTIFPGQKLYIE